MSDVGKLFNERKLKVPLGRCLEGDSDDEEPFPFYIAADEAFPLQPDIMRPFSGCNQKQKERHAVLSTEDELDAQQSHKKKSRDLSDTEMVFNYHFSRGRHVVENVFGIAASRFRVLLSAMSVKDERNAEAVIMACVVLHNFLTKEDISVRDIMARLNVAHQNETQNARTQQQQHEQGDRDRLQSLHVLPGKCYKDAAVELRMHLAAYFMGVGAVQFQWKEARLLVLVSSHYWFCPTHWPWHWSALLR